MAVAGRALLLSNRRLDQRTSLAIPPVLKIVALVVFAQTLFTRAVDPIIPMIAADLAIDVKTVALLSTAFTFPYALVQPALGVAGDFFGKTRLMNLCVLVVALTALICAFATSFSLLVAMRIMAGLVAGGVFPVAMALLGDLVPINQRQVAIARLLGVALTANVLGASVSGVIGDLFGWRGVFAVLGTFSLIAAILAYWSFRNVVVAKPQKFNRAAMIANFRGIFADPRAKVCFVSVFLEAIFIQGLFPYVAILLRSIGETRASIAGLLIACFAIGGVTYSLAVPYLANRVPQPRLMVVGGAIASLALALIALHFPWQGQIAVYAAFGFGFYLLHSCIQVHVTDLSHTARGAAASLHSSSFYLGQAIGPIIYGFGFTHGGPEPTLFTGAMVVLGVGIVCARLLRRPAVP
jgi:predicted MFS family arabinose efflux permease